MSYTEIYAVHPNGNIEDYGEAHNAWGGAMHIWMKLGEKYGIKGTSPFDLAPLWKSINQMNVTDQWVMASTFDKVIIPKEQLSTFAQHLRSFVAKYPTPNLTEQLAVLERAVNDDTVQGICFNQTSVNDNPWYIYDESNDGEGRPYNVNSDTGHWYLTSEAITNQSN